MARYDDGLQQSVRKARKQEEDRRRMAYRRAIESFCEERKLMAELDDFADLRDVSFRPQFSVMAPRNAQHAH